VIQAFVLGAVAQSSLVLSGLLPYVVRIPDRVVGLLAGAGAGALISAVAFSLIPEANAISQLEVAGWLLVGAAVFIVLDRFIDSMQIEEGPSPSSPKPAPQPGAQSL